jgi:membrane protease YdiL (CAAX protease family)
VFFGGRPFLPEALVGLFSLPVVVIVVIVTSLVIRLVAPQLHNVEQNPFEGLLGTETGLLAFLFVVIVAGGLREELQRVFLLHRFRHDLGGVRVGLLLTSVAFGLGHTLQGWDAAVITASLGALWGWISLTRGSAAASIVSHSLFNSGELIRTVFT